MSLPGNAAGAPIPLRSRCGAASARCLALLLIVQLTSPARADEGTPPVVILPQRTLTPHDLYDAGFLSLARPTDVPNLADAGPRRGKPGKRIEAEEFLRLVGRPDLVDVHQRADSIRTALFATGAVALGAGVVTLLATFLSDWNVYNYSGCPLLSGGAHCGAVTAGYTVGANLVALGPGLIVFGAIGDFHDVSSAVARDLANHYNEELRQRLGLPGNDGNDGNSGNDSNDRTDRTGRNRAPSSEYSPSPVPSPPVRLTLSPFFNHNSGGVAVTGLF